MFIWHVLSEMRAAAGTHMPAPCELQVSVPHWVPLLVQSVSTEHISAEAGRVHGGFHDDDQNEERERLFSLKADPFLRIAGTA